MVYSFRSGETHNAFEQVVYIGDAGRVVLLTLSARDLAAFDRTLALFRRFASSWGGSIQVSPPK
jgi:hypothetical protein